MLFGRGTVGFIVTCSLLLPGAADAQDPSRPDPDSPAGVEYQLPLDQARRDAAPDGGGAGPRAGGGAEASTPLFGAGITPDRSQGDDRDGVGPPAEGDKRGGGERSDDGRDPGSAGTGGVDGPGPRVGDSAPSSITTAAESGGGSTGLILGGIALAVVVVGGALGLALRRGLETTPAP